MSYILFWGKPEFRALYEHQETVLDLILSKTVKYLASKGIEVTDGLINIPGYIPFTYDKDIMDGF